MSSRPACELKEIGPQVFWLKSPSLMRRSPRTWPRPTTRPPRPRDELALDGALAGLRRRRELAIHLKLDGALACRPRGGEKYRVSERPIVFPPTPYLWHPWSDQTHISHAEQAEAQV